MIEYLSSCMNFVVENGLSLGALTTGVAVPLLVYRWQRTRETLEFIHAVRTMWISIDSVVLQTPGLIKIADSITNPKEGGSDDSQLQKNGSDDPQLQKKWLTLMILNAIYMDYLGAKRGFHSHKALVTISQSLEKFVVSNEFYCLTQNEGAYDDGFRALCNETLAAVTKKRTDRSTATQKPEDSGSNALNKNAQT